MSAILRLAARLYAGLLRLYPLEFQAEFGAEQQGVFAETVEEATERGPAQLALVCLRELRDAPFNLALAHWRGLRKRFGMENIPLLPNPTRAARWGAIGFGLGTVMSTLVWFILRGGVAMDMSVTIPWQNQAMQTALMFLLAALRGGLAGAILGLALHQKARLRQYIQAGMLGFVAYDAFNQIATPVIAVWIRDLMAAPFQFYVIILPYDIVSSMVFAAILVAVFGGWQTREQAARMFLVSVAGFCLALGAKELLNLLLIWITWQPDNTLFQSVGAQLGVSLILGLVWSTIEGWAFGWALGQQKASEMRRATAQAV